MECRGRRGSESRVSGWRFYGARPFNDFALRYCGARSRPVSLNIVSACEALKPGVFGAGTILAAADGSGFLSGMSDARCLDEEGSARARDE